MRLIVPSLLLLAAASLGGTALAQAPADIPPPKPPLVAAVPKAADWTITVKRTNGTPTPAPSPKGPASRPSSSIVEVHSTKSDPYRRDTIIFSDGRSITNWIQGTLVFWMNTQGQASVSDSSTFPPMAAEDPEPTAADGFPGTRWLQLSFYDKVVAVEKRPCYHYVHGESEAWIDVESRFPVAYKSGDNLYSYRFGEAPTEPLTLPAEFQKAAERVQQMSLRRRLLEGGPTVKR